MRRLYCSFIFWLCSFHSIAWIPQCRRAPSSVILMLPKPLWMLYVTFAFERWLGGWEIRVLLGEKNTCCNKYLNVFCVYYCVTCWGQNSEQTNQHLRESWRVVLVNPGCTDAKLVTCKNQSDYWMCLPSLRASHLSNRLPEETKQEVSWFVHSQDRGSKHRNHCRNDV